VKATALALKLGRNAQDEDERPVQLLSSPSAAATGSTDPGMSVQEFRDPLGAVASLFHKGSGGYAGTAESSPARSKVIEHSLSQSAGGTARSLEHGRPYPGRGQDLASRLKAVATRPDFGCCRCCSPSGRACTWVLTDRLVLSQPTVSHHLKQLADAGPVSGERRGVWTYHRVNRDALAAAGRPPAGRVIG
jgi:DNA-binding transcriptional ArsR family regulator